jgi:hypothetical protein
VYHQAVTFVTDGGDTVRSWPKRLHPRAEHVIDWFHIAMRFTVLKQMAKGIAIPDANPDDPDDHPGRVARQSGWQRDNQDGKFFDRSIFEAFGSELTG